MLQLPLRITLFVILSSFAATNLFGQEVSPRGLTAKEAREKAALHRATRQASAQPMVLVAPYYSISEDEQASLILISTVSQTLEIEIFAKTVAGREQSLGKDFVAPHRHVSLALDRLVPGDQPELQEGSLSLHFLGDSNALQAWLVLERRGQVTEVPLQLVGAVQSTELTSFWQHPAPAATSVF